MVLEKKETKNNLSNEKKDLQKNVLDMNLSSLNEKVELSDSAKKTLEIMKDTKMYTTLKNIEKDWKIPDFSVEKYAHDIDVTVMNYLHQTFLETGKESEFKITQASMDTISVGTQFAMMEAFQTSGSDIFTNFSTIQTNSVGNVFDGLCKVFAPDGLIGKVFTKAGNINTMKQLANRVQNCIWYISSKTWTGKQLWDGSKCTQLNNPNEFRKLVNNKIRDTDTSKKTLQEVGITLSDTEISAADKILWEDQLKAIANATSMDEGSINAIQKSLPVAMNILQQRSTYKTKASELMDKVGGFLSIDLLWLWTLWSLLEISSPAELFGYKRGKEKKWLVNFVLKVMWFENGLEWLHRSYVEENIATNLHNHPDKEIKESFIKDSLADYQEHVQWTYTGTDLLVKYNLQNSKETFMTNVPTQYDTLKNALVTGLKDKETCLNPAVVTSLWIRVNKDANWNASIDATAFTAEDIVVKYLDKEIPELVKNEDFMTNIKDSSHFALALMGNLVADRYFIEWVLIWSEETASYLANSSSVVKSSDEKVQTDEQLLTTIQTELDSKKSPVKAEWVISTSKKYSVPVEYIMAIMKNDSAYGTTGVAVHTHNPGNVGNVDNGTTKDWGTREAWVNAVGQNLQYRIKEYKRVYTGYPTLQALADNVWPDGKWFLSDQWNYKKENKDRIWAYMSAKNGWKTVLNIENDLTVLWITNRVEYLMAA